MITGNINEINENVHIMNQKIKCQQRMAIIKKIKWKFYNEKILFEFF